jgi:hypothetical protein
MAGDDDYEDETVSILRTHMNSGIKEEHCKICVCSMEGKDEYCSGRPARNVNECMRMSGIMEEFKTNIPYDHTRGLPYRIRRGWSCLNETGAVEIRQIKVSLETINNHKIYFKQRKHFE